MNDLLDNIDWNSCDTDSVKSEATKITQSEIPTEDPQTTDNVDELPIEIDESFKWAGENHRVDLKEYEAISYMETLRPHQKEATKEIFANLHTVVSEEPISKIKYYIKEKSINATAVITADGVKVLKDSIISETNSLPPLTNGKRDLLIQHGIIKDLIFTKDFIFPNSTFAASIILGRSVNGSYSWKTESDHTMFEEGIKI